MLIPIRLFTLPSPLRSDPPLVGASVRKSCTARVDLKPPGENGYLFCESYLTYNHAVLRSDKMLWCYNKRWFLID